MAHPFRESSPQNYKIGARSCLGCHRRKVRCDRGVPCANCSKCGLTCVYRTKNSEVARKSLTLQTISNRLERLEILLSRFAESSRVTTESAAAGGGGSGGESQSQVRLQSGANFNATANQRPSDNHSCKSTWELLLNDGQTGSETAPSHLQESINAHHTLLAQPGACAPLEMVSDVLEFYPDPQLALRLWTVYVKSVDPVLKILHIPTAQSAVVATILDPKSAGSSTVALTFAIYFAAVTALGHDDENELIELPWEKLVLLTCYKMALDQLLMVTDLMNRPEMVALQALAIYAVSTEARPGVNHAPLLGWSI